MPALRDIKDLTFSDLQTYLEQNNQPVFRAQQIFTWLYHQEAKNFQEMKNIPPSLRAQLARDFLFSEPRLEKEQLSKDGTKKFLLSVGPKERIETVFIPSQKRGTICLSTQVGCKFGCAFCASGLNGWQRNLSCAEILNEILFVQRSIKPKEVTHVVFMGTGEPLDNYDNVMSAVNIIHDPHAFNIGARRMTISTCGIIPAIDRLSQEGLQFELSISLHGYDKKSREILMPISRQYAFDDLIEACRQYYKATNRQITFEYILIKGVTCSSQAVQSLKKAFQGLMCKMNLIVYNPIKEFDFEAPSREEIDDFCKALKAAGILATLRTPRGKDIQGACGQLRHIQKLTE